MTTVNPATLRSAAGAIHAAADTITDPPTPPAGASAQVDAGASLFHQQLVLEARLHRTATLGLAAGLTDAADAYEWVDRANAMAFGG